MAPYLLPGMGGSSVRANKNLTRIPLLHLSAEVFSLAATALKSSTGDEPAVQLMSRVVVVYNIK